MVERRSATTRFITTLLSPVVTIRMFLASRFRKLMFVGILAWFGCAAAGFSASAGLIPEWVEFLPFAGFGASTPFGSIA